MEFLTFSLILMCQIANYITVRTDAYRVNVTAEVFKTSPETNETSPGNIIARDCSTFFVERKPKNENEWTIIQRENINIYQRVFEKFYIKKINLKKLAHTHK